MMQARHGTIIVWLSLAFAALLTVLPCPPFLNSIRPLWVPLTLIYWCMALPHRYGIVTAFFTGLCLDVIADNLLGLNALLMALVAYFCMKFYSRLRMFTRLMQAGIVLTLIGIILLLRLWILNAVERQTITLMYWLPALSSAVVWFLWFPILRFLRRRFAVS